MSLDQRADILQIATLSKIGVKELIHRISGQRAQKTVSLLKSMYGEGLVELKNVSSRKPGRPKKLVVPTVLGIDFLDSYNTLKKKRLFSNKNDLEHAKKDAAYTQRLKGRGLDLFQLFLELNDIAGYIKVSS